MTASTKTRQDSFTSVNRFAVSLWLQWHRALWACFQIVNVLYDNLNEQYDVKLYPPNNVISSYILYKTLYQLTHTYQKTTFGDLGGDRRLLGVAACGIPRGGLESRLRFCGSLAVMVRAGGGALSHNNHDMCGMGSPTDDSMAVGLRCLLCFRGMFLDTKKGDTLMRSFFPWKSTRICWNHARER